MDSKIMEPAQKKTRAPALKLNGDRSEDEFQAAVAKLLDYAFYQQPTMWTHFPAGGYRLNHASRARLARLGLKPGFPDILVWWKPTKDDVWARSLGIELKSVIGRPTNAQQARHAALLAIGVPVRICKSEEEVVLWLRQNHVPMNRFTLIGGKHGDGATESSGQEELAQGAWR